MPAILGIFVFVGVLALIGLAAAIILYGTLFLGPPALAIGAYIWYRRHPWYPAKARYDALAGEWHNITVPEPEVFLGAVQQLYIEQLHANNFIVPRAYILRQLFDAVGQLYAAQPFPQPELPALPEFQWSIKPAPLTFFEDRLTAAETEMQLARMRLKRFSDACLEMMIRYTRYLPRAALRTWDEFRAGTEPTGLLWVPLTQSMTNAPWLVGHVTQPFWSSSTGDTTLFSNFTSTYSDNRRVASLDTLSPTAVEDGARVGVAEYAGPGDATQIYLKSTSIAPLFHLDVPFTLPDHERTEHALIVARSGGGKSQLLESLVLQDLDQDDPPSIVVIDSKAGQPDLFQRISRLDLFHPDHGRLRDRLVIVDPRDEPALNLFTGYGGDSDAMWSAVRYFINGLLGDALSQQMNAVLEPVVGVAARIEGATLPILLDIMDNPKKEEYQRAIEQLPAGQRNFMQTHFARVWKETTGGVRMRLNEILTQPKLEATFAAKHNALNMAEALNGGKIVLISTELGYLGDDLSTVFGRYFIGQIIAAARQRHSVPRDKRKRVHVYIDEAKPYTDDKLEEMFRTLRSYEIGITIAYTNLRDMGIHSHSILTNTAIKLASGVQDSDARALADNMGTTVEFLRAQQTELSARGKPSYADFACFTTSSRKSVSVRNFHGQLDKRLLLGDEDYARLRAEHRKTMRGDTPPSPSLPPQKPRLRVVPKIESDDQGGFGPVA